MKNFKPNQKNKKKISDPDIILHIFVWILLKICGLCDIANV